MPVKVLTSRVVNKHATEAKWNSSSLVPMQGELIIYDVDSNYTYERFKIGDGIHSVNELPFATEILEDAILDSVADWNQNDDSALDYVKNRTHYDSRTDGEVNITYNGELTGYEIKQLSDTEHLVKVSNLTATEDQLIGAAIVFLGANSMEHYAVGASNLTHDNGNIYVHDCVLIVPEDTEEFSKGTWFKRVEDSIAVPTYPMAFAYVGTAGELKKLDSKYLPDTVLLTEEQLLTAEQRKQVRTNIDRYTWKTFRDSYGSYTYTIDKMPSLDFDKAQTVANVSGDGAASALESIVSWASAAAVFYPDEDAALNLVKNTVANYEALFENGAITGSLSLLLQRNLVVHPDEYAFVGITRISYGGATHVFQASTIDHNLSAYYNVNDQTITSFSSSYTGVDRSLSVAGRPADAKVVGDRFEQLKDSIDLLNNGTSIQADWSQTDETAVNFIKNKPDEMDALLLVSELGFTEPAMVDVNNNVYLDGSDNILIL